jgi:hypothetical protein
VERTTPHRLPDHRTVVMRVSLAALALTAAVRMADPRALAHLRRGAFVKLRCDERPNPWVCVRR